MAGRPEKHTVDYFSHDAAAGSGRTLTILFNRFGHDGISAWWQLLEILASTNNHIINLKKGEELEYLAARMRFTVERLKEILDGMASLEAIDSELFNIGLIWSQNFVDRLEPVYKTRQQKIPPKPDITIFHPGANLPSNSISSPRNPISDTSNSISSPRNTQTKESKLKETKVERESTRAFGEFSNVKLTPEEYEKLVTRFGDQGAADWIQELSLAKASKGYKSKSDYATILAWERREKKNSNKGDKHGAEKNQRSPGQPRKPEEYTDPDAYRRRAGR